MRTPSRQNLARAVLERHGRTFAEELGINVERNTPVPLFRLLCLSLLSSSRTPHAAALEAARALVREGMGSPTRLAAASRGRRAAVLRRAGYVRFADNVAAYLGDAAEHLRVEYSGDLRGLRERSAGEASEMRRLLKEFRGIGDVGAGIFLREAQLAWEELYPFADARALSAAARLGLGGSARALARLVDGRSGLVRLVGGLVRVDLEDGYEELRAAA